MESNERRLHISNLPDNITVGDIKKKFEKYSLTKVELKPRNSSVFAFVNISDEYYNKCIHTFKKKKWKGKYLKIEDAKESFMERLQNERKQNCNNKLKSNPTLRINVTEPVYNPKILNEDIRKPVVPNNVRHDTLETNLDKELDLKRMNAIDEKRRLLEEKRNIVQQTLREGIVLNKKIYFNDDNDEVDNLKLVNEKTTDVSDDTKKIQLFNDDDSSDDFIPNFNDGCDSHGINKTAEVLRLKTKNFGDERFKLDSRFFEPDENNSKMNNKKKKHLEMISKKNIDNRFADVSENELPSGPLIRRFDPSIPEHEKYEIKKSKQINSSEKLKKKKKPSKKNHERVNTIPIKEAPKVSDDKFYKVADNLKDVFKKSENSEFRLTELFDKLQTHSDCSNTNQKTSDIENTGSTHKFIRNPILDENEFSDFEVEIDENAPVQLPVPTVPEKILGPRGIWRDSFFFKENDSRFEEAKEFFVRQESKNFDEVREVLHAILKRKRHNSLRDARQFKQNNGGRVNRLKFNKRLKRLNQMKN